MVLVLFLYNIHLKDRAQEQHEFVWMLMENQDGGCDAI